MITKTDRGRTISAATGPGGWQAINHAMIHPSTRMLIVLSSRPSEPQGEPIRLSRGAQSEKFGAY
jgi:hypothetical protein